jgi:hypothetical protein
MAVLSKNWGANGAIQIADARPQSSKVDEMLWP